MKAKITFEDGKTVELSQETTDKLRAELVKPLPLDHNQLKVGRFRATQKSGWTSGMGLAIAIMGTSHQIWDKEFLPSNALGTDYLHAHDVQKIIDGLTKMLKEQNGN